MANETNVHQLSKGDDPFTARMRFHQSWYREHVLKRPAGPNPSARNQIYGNMLRPEDGAAGLNFLTDTVRAAVAARLAKGKKGIELKRLQCNMLSSQPMCFNLFGHLAMDPNLATHLMAVLPAFPIGAKVTKVDFEFAPDPETHLKDSTAFDAFVEYRRPDGKMGFFGIETKLTEPFSQEEYCYDERYSKWEDKSGWWWRAGPEKAFPDKCFNQLWRNHLLAFAILNQTKPRYIEGHCAVVWHPKDSSCKKSIYAYRQHLREETGATLVEWPLDVVVGGWEDAKSDQIVTAWLAAFRQRYLSLNESEAAWRMESGNRSSR